MPKIGARTAEPEQPHVLRCVNCGCVGLSRLTTRFTPWGTPVGMIYACDQWPVAHRCDTAEREGCAPERVYTDVIHTVDAKTGDGTTKNLHPGPREKCVLKQCLNEAAQAQTTPHVHRFEYADDDNGHSGSFCDCGEEEPDHNRGPWGDWPPSGPSPWLGPLAGDEDE